MKPKSPRSPRNPLTPRWDGWTLWWGRTKIREFEHNAPSQFPILVEFEEKRWARSIDASQIMPSTVKRKKLWIRNNLRNLNRGIHKARRPGAPAIEFHADVANLRISWTVNK